MFEFCFCHLSVIPLRADHKDEAEIITQMLFGEVATVLKEHQQWLYIKLAHDGYEGWIDHKQVFQISNEEFSQLTSNKERQEELFLQLETPYGVINTLKGSLIPSLHQQFKVGDFNFSYCEQPKKNTRQDISKIALSYLNSPYLWGGRTLLGIDCSGFTQAVFHFLGFQLPRDASQQISFGQTVPFEEIASGDLVYFKNDKDRIHHVAIALADRSCIHASGQVRVDKLTKNGILHTQTGKLTHALHSIKRLNK